MGFNQSLCDRLPSPFREHCRGESELSAEAVANLRSRLLGLPIEDCWPDQKPAPPRPLCGTHLKRLLASLGQEPIVAPVGPQWCGCQQLADEMDRNGPQWCRDNRDRIAAQLKASADERGWGAKMMAAVMAIKAGIALKIDLSDLYGSLVDEAIRRAEECTK